MDCMNLCVLWTEAMIDVVYDIKIFLMKLGVYRVVYGKHTFMYVHVIYQNKFP